jgi:hypothetical protein
MQFQRLPSKIKGTVSRDFFYIKFADNGGKFADGLIAITINLWKGVTTGVFDTSCKFATVLAMPAVKFASSAHLEFANF